MIFIACYNCFSSVFFPFSFFFFVFLPLHHLLSLSSCPVSHFLLLPLFFSSYCPLYTLSLFRIFSFLCIIYFVLYLSHSLVLFHFLLFNSTFISSFSPSPSFPLSLSFLSPSFYFSFFLIFLSFIYLSHSLLHSLSLLPV
jgi:hypothetical protein